MILIFAVACGHATHSTGPHPRADLAGLEARDLSAPAPLADAGAADAAGLVYDLAAARADGGLAPADWRRQVIYLAIVDRFANGSTANDTLGLPGCLDRNNPQAWHGGDFVGLQQKLGYLSALGVSALWITPANKQATGPTGRCGYHGYWADFTTPDDGAVERRLGSAAELSALVGAAHAQGMAFILDMVVNHAGDGARIAAEAPGWFHDPATCAALGPSAVYCPYRAGIHDFAQEDPAVAHYLSSLSAGWVARLGIDGVRMDTAKYVLPSYFHDSWVPSVRAAHPLFLVAEVFSSAPADLAPYLDAGFDSTFNFPLYFAIAGAIGHEQSVDAIATVLATEQTQLGAARARTLVNMIDNHDVQRFANEPGAQVASDEIRRRLQLALAIQFAAPGIPQLYMGDELGLFGGPDPDNRRDMPAWAWTAAARATSQPPEALPNAQLTFDFVHTLVALRRAHDALADGDYVELWRQNGAGNANVLAFARVAPTETLIFVANGGATAATLSIPLQKRVADGVMLDELYGGGAPALLQASGGNLAITLPPKTAGLYRPR